MNICCKRQIQLQNNNHNYDIDNDDSIYNNTVYLSSHIIHDIRSGSRSNPSCIAFTSDLDTDNASVFLTCNGNISHKFHFVLEISYNHNT